MQKWLDGVNQVICSRLFQIFISIDRDNKYPAEKDFIFPISWKLFF